MFLILPLRMIFDYPLIPVTFCTKLLFILFSICFLGAVISYMCADFVTDSNWAIFLKLSFGPLVAVMLGRTCLLIPAIFGFFGAFLFLLIGLIQFYQLPVFSSSLDFILSLMMSRYHGSPSEYTGISVITPEPSFVIFHLIFFAYCVRNTKSWSLNLLFFIVTFAVALLSKSALSIILLVVFYGLRFLLSDFLRRYIVFSSIFSICSLLGFYLLIPQFPRLAATTSSLSSVFELGIDAVLLRDESLGNRLLFNLSHILSSVSSPFGRLEMLSVEEVNNSLRLVGLETAAKMNWTFISHVNSGKLHAQAYFSNLVSTVGIFSVLFLTILFLLTGQVIKKKRVEQIPFLFCLFAFFMLQSQMTNPIPWLILGAMVVSNGSALGRTSDLHSSYKQLSCHPVL
jgi:hypothetical protein